MSDITDITPNKPVVAQEGSTSPIEYFVIDNTVADTSDTNKDHVITDPGEVFAKEIASIAQINQYVMPKIEMVKDMSVIANTTDSTDSTDSTDNPVHTKGTPYMLVILSNNDADTEREDWGDKLNVIDDDDCLFVRIMPIETVSDDDNPSLAEESIKYQASSLVAYDRQITRLTHIMNHMIDRHHLLSRTEHTDASGHGKVMVTTVNPHTGEQTDIELSTVELAAKMLDEPITMFTFLTPALAMCSSFDGFGLDGNEDNHIETLEIN